MAERRCFSRKVVESDAFHRLPRRCQALYLHLNMAADDDGFINCAGAVVTMNRCEEADLARLVEAGFLLQFGDVFVVKHWRISNSLKNDRLKVPSFPAVAAQIYVKSNRAYSVRPDCGGENLLALKNGRRLESKMDSKMDSKMESQPNRTEPNRREENRTEPNRRHPGFDALYDAYPAHRRGRYEEGLGIYLGLGLEDQQKQILAVLECWKKSNQWNKEDGQYVPTLANWLSRELWRQPPRSGSPSGVLGEAELEAIRRIMKEEI